MKTPPAHAVVVLAAGRSRRLGQPKQLLRRQGETLLHRTVRLAEATAPGALIVVLAEGEAATRAAISDIACRTLFNPDPAGGLAGSLRMAATHAATFAQVLVLVCDQPALTLEHLRALLHGARTAASACAATLLDGVPGVPAVVPGSWFEALPPGSGDAGFRGHLRRLDPGSLFLLPGQALQQDIDTPAALAQARAAGRIDPA